MLKRLFRKSRPHIPAIRLLTAAFAAVFLVLTTAGTSLARDPRDIAEFPIGREFTGPVRQVIDGDTLRMLLDGRPVDVRIHGIDAPEHDQICLDAGRQRFPCGHVATETVVDLVRGRSVHCPSDRMHGLCLAASMSVSCKVTGHDTKNMRPVARCLAGTTDIGEYMVRIGQAKAFTFYSRDYEQLDAVARNRRIGFWAGTFDDPAGFRPK